VRTNTDLATMEAANEAARLAVNGILKASRSDAFPCAVWDLHEPEIFLPWRELDAVRYARGLPWDDALVNVGLSVAALVDKAILELEHGSESHDVFETRSTALGSVPEQIYALVDRKAQQGFTSDLRRDATALVERFGRLVALRLAEAEAPGRVPGGMMTAIAGSPMPAATPRQAAAGRTRPGRVHILPR
jgi:hypothetical protein